MKIVLLSDMHLSNDIPVARLDDAKNTGYAKFLWVLEWAFNNRAAILQAGDLCDKMRSWELLSDMLGIFYQQSNNKGGCDFYGIYGQHDTYLYNSEARRKTILGALYRAGYVNILDESPFELNKNVRVYGCSFGQEVPKVQNKNCFNILVIHAPIAAKALWPGHDYMDAKKFLDSHPDYDIILAGDIHQNYCIPTIEAAFGKPARYIVNSGPLLRREATEYNMTHKPGFWVFDTTENKMERVEVPHKPADKVLSRDHITTTVDSKLILKDFIDSVKAEIEEDTDFISNLIHFINDNKIPEPVLDVLATVISDERFQRREE